MTVVGIGSDLNASRAAVDFQGVLTNRGWGIPC